MKSGLFVAVAMTMAAAAASAQVPPATSARPPEPGQARGAFTPTVTPLPAPEGEAARSHGRFGLTKTWTGGMVGESGGELLGTLQDGSGAYVAIERFTGVLDGRRGAFSLVHRGQMVAGGAPQIDVVVAPGTGEGELAGITGAMTLILEGGRHDYVLDYELPVQPR